jgi:uncharacterized membrane protein YeaQ/YmgE (transglycosylase-associated protein family)
MEYFWVVVIGVGCGLLAGKFMAGKGYGATVDLIAGVLGAVIGCVLVERTDLFGGSGIPGSLAVATTGALVFLYSLRLTQKA